MDTPTALATLLKEAFPQWPELEPDCWVLKAIEDNRDDLEELVQCLDSAQGRQDFSERLALEHPCKAPHDHRHDERLLDALTEGLAFAWAYSVARLGRPRFVKEPGAPDLRVGDVWIEAKTARQSAEEERLQRAVQPLLIRETS